MTDTERLDWQERTGAQVWRERGQWTLFLRCPPRYAIQPNGASIREVIDKGMELHKAHLEKQNTTHPNENKKEKIPSS